MLDSNKKFIESLVSGAQEAYRTYKVPASVSIAQAILESGWGKKVDGNNLFGIKADSSWHGEKILVDTHEYVHGKKIPVKAWFRKYETFADSIKDHAKFLADNDRYDHAFECDTGCAFAKSIAKAGYATDPAYGNLLSSIITQNVLQKYD